MNKHLSLLLVPALFLCGSIGWISPVKAAAANPDIGTIAEENNDFALDLYGQLAPANPGNLFFSPYSIDSALAMTLTGAAGQTAAQMRQVLHSSLSPKRMNAGFADLSNELDSGGTVNGTQVYDLAVANALWGQSGLTFNPKFLQTLLQDYGAAMNLGDFQTNADGVASDINQWVAQQTNNKITDLIPLGALTAKTRLVLVNAIYFLGKWESGFDPAATENLPFHLGYGQPDVTAPTMQQTAYFSYMENDELQVLEMPYVGGNLSMVVLLPRDVDGLPELEQMLDSTRLDRWMSKMEPYTQVVVQLPKFTTTSTFYLASTLGNWGMTDAFSAKADFSGITSAEKIRLNQVIHKAYVDVKETGTEAAGATAIIGGTITAIVEGYYPPPPVYFWANHPFIFLIRDNVSGAILFMGRVTNPND